MNLYPGDIIEKLEFDKILQRLSSFCMGAPAKSMVLAMRCYNKVHKIEQLLDEVVEFKKSIDMGWSFPLSHYETILDQIGLLRKIDYVLEVEDYISIYNHIRNIAEIAEFFSISEKRTELPLLFKISEQIEVDATLLKTFEKIFSEDGKIKPSASPALRKIFSMISSKERELDQVFKRLVGSYKKQGLLSDNIESVKNSRRVLSVNAENKRKIKGIIHDESSTGKTVFIEPEEVMILNNDLFDLEAQKRLEVYKILRQLSADLRPHLDDFVLWQKILVRYDLIRSKAFFAREYGGQRPNVSGDVQLKLVQAFHPLLLLLNDEQSKPTISFDLELDTEKRILVISGPNAGGKSVTLKAVGLLQMMLQSGMLVPVNSDSCFSVFNKIMIDIGDQQSLEGDLSTYSSRLTHMRYFLEKGDRRSLVLMDEFGSGSDPKMGGAIAESVLHKIVAKKSFAVITTHYSNIKNYAFKSKNILNGAMLFDTEELKPTYKLKVGQPGSSFAFEIADKIGLPPDVLKAAKNKAGRDSEKIDKILIDLQTEKKELEDKLLEVYDERARLNKLISNYETMKQDLEIRRKKLKLEAKEKAYLNMSDTEKELNKLLRELKKEKDLEKAKKLSQRIKSVKSETRSEMSNLSDDIFVEEIKEVKNLEVGQYVKLRSGGEPGKVISFNDKKVKLEMGLLQFEVPRNEIISANQPIEAKPRSINTNTLSNPDLSESKLDIRGYTKVDAMDAIQSFLDNALMSNVHQLKVLHGKGTGVLKRTLWDKAKEYKDIKKLWHPEEEFGGVGVTYISF